MIHTEVEPELEGKGAATAVIEKTLDYIEKDNYKLVPLCPLVFAYIKSRFNCFLRLGAIKAVYNNVFTRTPINRRI